MLRSNALSTGYTVAQSLLGTFIGFLAADPDVPAGADHYAAAALLVGSCLQHAFLGHMGWAERRGDDEAARGMARALCEGLACK